MKIVLVGLICSALLGLGVYEKMKNKIFIPPGRQRIVLWHLWTGKWQKVVESIVARFNAQQDDYFVDPLLILPDNADTKFFMAVAGGVPPDLMIQWNNIIPDWAHRGILLPIDTLMDQATYQELLDWLFPLAKKIGLYDNRLYAVANGLDIWGLLVNRELCISRGISGLPTTIARLDSMAESLTERNAEGQILRIGFCFEDNQDIWNWAGVFGGGFYDEARQVVTVDHPKNIAALEWMVSHIRRYGVNAYIAFMSQDREKVGTKFPFLSDRQAMVVAGQWRVHDIAEARPGMNYEVLPLPYPQAGRPVSARGGGNFFIIPKGARCLDGVWAFIKFWSGFGGFEEEAARICEEGAWIPASDQVVQEKQFQDYCRRFPHFQKFVEFAKSSNIEPLPPIPIQSFFRNRVERGVEEALYLKAAPAEALARAQEEIEQRLSKVREK